MKNIKKCIFSQKKSSFFKYFPLVEMHESVNMVPIRKKEGPIMSTKKVIFLMFFTI